MTVLKVQKKIKTLQSYSSDCTFAFLLKIDKGIKFARTVVAMGDEKELSSRGYLALGIGYSLLASEGNVLVISRTAKDGLGRSGGLMVSALDS